MSILTPQDRDTRIAAIASDWWRRRQLGSELSEADLIFKYPDLMPELGVRLQFLRRLAHEANAMHDRGMAPRLRTSKPTSRQSFRSRTAYRRLLDASEVATIWFEAGTIIAGRYVISCYLGEGGLGTVFLAYDKLLSKPVALKFFRDSVLCDNRRHIQTEVALSQRVSHVNVCRVHDLNMEHEPAFLSMEYIDGEDLDQTLLRVGRIMEERALLLALEICAGLATAHANGVLHRDLKPHNVMIDSAGIARITDFGLGRLSLSAETQEGVVGTPLYMAPEQIHEGRATERSDLFSLGIVLYEMFTGEFPIELDDSRTIPDWETSRIIPPSDIVPRMDPVVERTILKCLELRPEDRPSSVDEVKLTLEGDWASRSRLPSSQPSKSMGPRAIRWMAILTVIGLVGGHLISPNFRLIERQPFGKTSIHDYDQMALQVFHDLKHESEHNIGKYGSGFQYDSPFRNDVTARDQTVSFWFRQSPHYLVPRNYAISREQNSMQVSFDDPPWVTSGMLGARFDATGRLIEFRHVLDRPLSIGDGELALRRLDRLFMAAKLDLDDYEAAPADEIAERDSGQPFSTFGEARFYRGKPSLTTVPHVRVNVVGDDIAWFHVSHDDASSSSTKTLWKPIDQAVYLFLMCCGVLGCILARRNSANAQSDRRGAWRSAVVIFVGTAVGWLFSASHVPVFGGELHLMQFGLANAIFWGGTQWLLYMAFEPFLRRESPGSLTSWGRVLGGQWRDPLVARDILVGCLVGATITPIIGSVHYLLRLGCGIPGRFEIPPIDLVTLETPWYLVAVAANAIVNAMYSGFVLLLLPMVMTKALGTIRAGTVLAWLFVSVFLGTFYGTGIEPLWDKCCWYAYMSVWSAVFLLVVRRFGLLTTITMVATFQMVVFTPSSLDGDRWYATTGVIMTSMMILAVMGYATFLLSARKATQNRIGPQIL